MPNALLSMQHGNSHETEDADVVPYSQVHKEALGCAVVGMVVSIAIYGITILQAYIYFRNSTQDSVRLRLFVGFLFILDTLSSVLAVRAFYTYIVTDFGDPLLFLNVPPTSALENGVAVLLRTLTQCYFACRVWSLSKGKIPLVASIAILALSSFGVGMVVTVNIYTNSYIFSIATVKMRLLTGIVNGLSVMCDIVIMASLCYYLRSRRTGFRRSDSIINRLTIYAVNRGVLTVICQGGEMITLVVLPGRFIFLPFTLVEAKLYCNTLFATLNAQKSLREDGDNAVELGPPIPNRRMNTSTRNTGNGEHRGTAERTDRSTSDGISTCVLDISSGKDTERARTPSVGPDAS
ncbi:hypothetical protein LXA43DRAFT_1018729 [Ganoderma leucocontextum]|nr:hypothetical protein LXA43DRAFT_1018729 [Ganoderma leucocontextum]